MKDKQPAGLDSPAMAWLNQGNVHHGHKRHSRARRAFEAAARIASVAGDRHMQALALCNLGVACHALGQGDSAKRHYEEALALQRELVKTDAGAWYAMAATQRNLADMSFHRGDLSDAHKRIDEALTIFLQYLQQDGLRVLPEVVQAMALRAYVDEAEGRLDSAVTHFEGAVRGRRTLCQVAPVEHRPALAATLDKLAAVCERLGREDDARRHREEAATLRALPPAGL